MNRSCQRQTHGLDLPARRMISAVPHPSAVARMIFARQACFWRLFRSAVIASRRARSAAETETVIPWRMRPAWHGGRAVGILRLRQTTSWSRGRGCFHPMHKGIDPPDVEAPRLGDLALGDEPELGVGEGMQGHPAYP